MKFLKSLIFISFAMVMFAGCQYNWILPEETTDPNPGGEPVSFATQVQPIFTAKCVSCHNTGGTSPDLSSGKAYNQVVPGYVNLTTPAESKIYTFPAPTTSVHSWKKLSANEATLLLTWIQEGAKNN